MARGLAMLGVVVGLLGLVLQFYLSIPASMTAGRSLFGSIVFFFSFFTILTNIFAVVTHLASLGFGPGFFRSARVRAAAAVSMTVVAIIYDHVLAPLWKPEGLWYLADATLHYATPAIMIAWWLLAGRDGSLRWSDSFRFLAYPVAYLAYALARAPLAGEVPYPFLDYMKEGWAAVAQASVGIAILFLVIGFAAVLTDRMLPRR